MSVLVKRLWRDAGWFSRAIVFSLLLSLATFAAFNLPNGGSIPDNILAVVGVHAMPPWSLGLLLSHFFHTDANHLVENAFGAIVLLVLALVVEGDKRKRRRPSRVQRPSLAVHVALPVLLATLALHVPYQLFWPQNAAVGLSVFLSYSLAFLLIAGRKDLWKQGTTAIAGVLSGKKDQLLRSFPAFALGVALAFALAAIAWGLFPGKPPKTQAAHAAGLAVGVMAAIWLESKKRVCSKKLVN